MSKIKFDTLVHEINRTYIFPNAQELSLDSIKKINVSKSGGHRLINDQKTMFYIPPTWLGIRIKSNKSWEI